MALTEEKRLAITRNILRTVQGTSVGIAQIEGILQDFDVAGEEVEERIFILSRLSELMRDLSTKTFKSGDQRFDVIDAVQEVLDHYIEVEDVITDEVS
jgi:hypothetical protein